MAVKRTARETAAHLLGGLRLGLCCQFVEAPIRFRTTTATACQQLSDAERRTKLGELCRHNADSLAAALAWCARLGIGCFRVTSQILPLATHPDFGYRLDEVPGGEDAIAAFERCGAWAQSNGIRTSFHPDQFVVLNSPREEVAAASLAEIEYQAQVAEWVGADVINVHGGGSYGSPVEALDRLARNLDRLTDAARARLTVENDDKIYSVADLLPLCRRHGLPLAYDVHHHRCRRDELTVEEATEHAIGTWNREPMFHISSPKEGWAGPRCERHHDFIDVNDFPPCWLGRTLTVEVEAKAKELAVVQLHDDLVDGLTARVGQTRSRKR
jgi:UV DNA damage endonuclease